MAMLWSVGGGPACLNNISLHPTNPNRLKAEGKLVGVNRMLAIPLLALALNSEALAAYVCGMKPHYKCDSCLRPYSLVNRLTQHKK